MEKQERTWATFCHLSGLLGFIIPFGNIAGPLLIWFLKKEQFSSLEKHGKEALNFQISMTIYTLMATILIFLLIGFPLLLALIVLDVVFVVKASIAANNGQLYHYPLTIRLIK